MNPVVADKIRGVVYGQAIGDALGLGTEFLTKSQVKEWYRYGLTRYGQILRDDHTRRWTVGSWTDDTDQMLCILDSLLEKKGVDVSSPFTCGEAGGTDKAHALHNGQLHPTPTGC